MYPYLRTARRYRWLLVAILALVWGTGFVAAAVEYATTYQSETTVWVQRAAPELASASSDDPSLPVIQTAASQQAELFSQFLKTDSFLTDVLARAGLAPNAKRSLEDVRNHFRVQTQGTRLLSVSYTDRDPHSAAEILRSALAIRDERVAKSRLASSAATMTLFRREFDIAQSQALDGQKALDEFDATHKSPLSDVDQRRQDQLRLALDFAQVRLGDLKGRVDRANVAPAILDVSGLEFQVVDEPREESRPRGGLRSAGMTAAVAMLAGLLLGALLVLVGTHITDHPAARADIERLEPSRVFASVPRLAGASGRFGTDLRARLSATAFATGEGARESGLAPTGERAGNGRSWR
jgi:uncharacterized protein involved in exopolysaccharide biosynthesis